MTALDVDLRLTLGGFALDAQFRAPGDGITAVFGPSGSGKSTLLMALAGLRRAQGHVRFGARDLQGLRAEARALRNRSRQVE